VETPFGLWEAPMLYYIMLRDREGVVGVWSTNSGVSATRWGLELSLTYPGYGVIVKSAANFEAFKQSEPGVDFSGHDAESLDRRREPGFGRRGSHMGRGEDVAVAG